MPPLLSYENYPDIIDSILAHIDVETTLAFRLTCHSFRGAVNRRQAAHLVLTPEGPDGAAVRGPQGRIAVLRRLGPLSMAQQPAHPYLNFTKHTRVLDIRGFFPASCDLTLLKAAFPSLHTLRICTRRGSYTPYVPINAETLVLYNSPHGGDCNPIQYANPKAGDVNQYFDSMTRLMSDTSDEEPPVLPNGVRHRDLPDGFRKIVVNMNGEDYAIADMFHCVLDPPEQIQEIVIVLPRYELSTFAVGFGLTLDGTFALKIIAKDIAEIMVGVPHVRYTLVGLESAGRTPAEFRNLLHEQLGAYQFHDVKYSEDYERVYRPDGEYDLKRKCEQPAKHEAKINRIMAQLQILSFRAYIRMVGKAKAIEELVEYSDGTPRGVEPRGILPNDIRRMGPAAQEW